MRATTFIGLVLALGLTSGCKTLGQQTTTNPAAPKPGVDVWLSKECPSLPKDDADVEQLSGFVDLLVGGAIDFLIDKTGSALTEAAKIDKEGRATSGKSPGFLFEAPEEKDGAPPYHIPTCATVVLSNSSPKKWCETEPFNATDACKRDSADSDSRIEKLLKQPPGATFRHGSDAPKFYAEIELYPSPDRIAFLPRLRALYYPAGIHNSSKFNGDKERNLSLKVTGTAPGGQSAVSTISVILKDIVPSQDIIVRDGGFKATTRHAILDKTEHSLWVAVAAPPKQLPKLDSGTRYNPVNLTAEVREIGDPNKFLQAIASAFTKNQEDLAKELKSKFVPGQREASEATEELQDLTNASALATAVAKAYENEVKLAESCAKTSDDKPNNARSEIRQHWAATSAAQLAVRKLEMEHDVDVKETFGLDVTALFNPADSARDNCNNIGGI